MQTFWQDVRYGARMMAKSPGFTLIAVITLALGIGANTAIFSVVSAVLLQAPPYQDPDRLVMVWEHNKPRQRTQNVINPANFLDWQEQNEVFEEMAAFQDFTVALTGGGEPEEITGQRASPNLFSLLGVQPIMGRGFAPEDGKPESERVVVLSHGFWQRRLGGDPQVVGRTLMLNYASVKVVGVMPADFKWFVKQASLVGKEADFWEPLGFTEEQRQVRRGRYLAAVARLRPGVTRDQAQAQMETLARRLEQTYPDSNTGWGVNVVPLQEQLVGDLRRPLLILLGAVAFILLIGCANVTNLFLARSAARQREVAVRVALGASRWRVVRLLLTESVLLYTCGGVAGLILALWGTDALVSLSPHGVISARSVGLNIPVLLFTLAVSLLTGLVFGLVPALESSRLNTNESLKETGRRMTGNVHSRRLRNLFVISEVALSLVLLIGAGLMLKSFYRLQAVDPGFAAGHLLTLRVSLPAAKYRDDQQRVAFFKQALERLGTLPGVESAGAISFLPFAGPGAATSFTIVGQPAPRPGERPSTDVRVTDANFFRTMKIPLVAGRTYNEREATEARHVVVINEALARRYFADVNPIGQKVLVNMQGTPTPTEIIGVVGDVKLQNLDDEPRATVYWPHAELAYPSMTLVVRTTVDPLSVAAAAEREIRQIDPDQPVSAVRTMESWLAASVARSRFNTFLLGLFSIVALALSIIGIYGVLAYSVAQRTHELGVRLALGAQFRDIIWIIVGEGMGLTLIGVVAGAAAAFALSRVMASLLYGVSATDPVIFAGVSLLLACVALVACYIPARRATRVDPLVALRYE